MVKSLRKRGDSRKKAKYGPSGVRDDLRLNRKREASYELAKAGSILGAGGDDDTRGVGGERGPVRGAFKGGRSARKGLKGARRDISCKENDEILHTVLSIGRGGVGLRKLAHVW